MNQELEQKLIERFPKHLGNVEFYAGSRFHCDNGWFVLVWMCLQELEQKGYTFEVGQIKEKWGRLQINPALRHYPFSDGERLADEAWEILESYNKKSGSVCEMCGKQGETRWQYSWIRTLCDGCVQGYEKISPLREKVIPEEVRRQLHR